MAAINHDVTEEQLREVRQAAFALEQVLYPDDEVEQRLGALRIEAGVFRGLVTLDSVRKCIANRARELFNIAVEKGHGNVKDCI